MKKSIGILFIFISTFSFAQTDSAGYLIQYSGKFNNQFGRGSDIRNYHGSLIIKGDKSLFTMKDIGNSIPLDNKFNVDLSPDSLFTVYKDAESSSLVFEFSDINQRMIYYADTLYPMDWKISQDKKSIDGIDCFKATTIFKGREYIAWYAPSLPIENGPWKLGGLPGLILEAYDIDDDLHFVCTSIQPNSNSDFSYYERRISKGLEGYHSFNEYMQKMFSRIKSTLASSQSGDCLTCETKSVVKLHTWEKIY
jgi:GLPGLI family protein